MGYFSEYVLQFAGQNAGAAGLLKVKKRGKYQNRHLMRHGSRRSSSGALREDRTRRGGGGSSGLCACVCERE